MDTMRVVFRADKSDDEVTAVFPDETWRHPSWGMGTLTACYAHIGQHGDCSLDWYRTTRPATESEYATLLQELRGIYESGDEPVKLRGVKRR